jgi:hypothetical protein
MMDLQINASSKINIKVVAEKSSFKSMLGKRAKPPKTNKLKNINY